jgi:RimJ/RimL family protein N-acetyltransferase
MRVERHGSAEGWLEAVRGAVDEVLDGLALSIVERLRGAPVPDGWYLVTVHHPDGSVAGHAVRAPGRKMVVGMVEPSALAALAADAGAGLPELPGLMGPSPVVDAFAAEWCAVTGAKSRTGHPQRLLVLRALRPAAPGPGAMRQAASSDLERLARFMRAFDDETDMDDRGRDPRPVVERMITEQRLFVWEDAEPVAMALKIVQSARSARIGAVYTPPELRGRGYASRLVSALTRHLLDAGYLHCTLFTQALNPTSNALYERLGYEPVLDLKDVWFDRP